MSIEQKNTLFVVALVLAVLASVALSGHFLLDRHVSQEIHGDLARAHRVYVTAQRRATEQLLISARSIRREPSLVAAAMTGDTLTVQGMLDDLYPRPGVDLIAVYLDTGPSGVAGVGSRPHLTTPQVLSSGVLRALVAKVVAGAPAAYGNAMVYDSLLRLVAIPIDNPVGGRIGVLMVARQVDGRAVADLKALVGADVALYSGNLTLGSTLPSGAPPPPDHDDSLLAFRAGGADYVGRVFPVLAGVDAGQAARVLLAHPTDSYWAPYRTLARNALYSSLLILLLAALLGISISRRTLTRPIRTLATAARAIGAGDLTQKVPTARRDELGDLARAFNAMAGSLSASRNDLESGRRRFHDFAGSSSDWLWETDRAGRFTYVSSGVAATLDMVPEQLLGRTLTELFPGDDVHSVMGWLRSGNGGPRPFKDLECWVTDNEGRRRCLRLNGLPNHEEGQFRGFRGTTRDITQAKQDEERMLILANQDHLTGLANRRRFLQDLANVTHDAGRRGQQGTLILVDLDHLKLINDTAGHAAGDKLIVLTADVLRRLAGDQDLVARVSGDEFALACPGLDEHQGMARAREVLEAVARLRPAIGGRTLSLSASGGVVIFPAHGVDAVDLLAKADTAMYAAKYAGRNRIHLYDARDMARERMNSQLTWKGRILQALDEDGFLLHFQPIVAAAGGGVHHYEVLVRMRGGDGKPIPPGQFIPTAEQFGLIRQIDRLVVSKAIRHLAALPAGGGSVGLSINLSGLSVGDETMLALIEREVRDAGIAPGRLTFEVTESAACEHMNRSVDFIQRIRRLGCHISLDDFGVGFSSFTYLKHLQVDTIKIDGSFIRDIQDNAADQLFVKALVDVARGMGMRTTAEFVESEACLDMVRRLGVDFVQGYHLGRPAPAIDVDAAALPVPGPSSALTG